MQVYGIDLSMEKFDVNRLRKKWPKNLYLIRVYELTTTAIQGLQR